MSGILVIVEAALLEPVNNYASHSPLCFGPGDRAGRFEALQQSLRISERVCSPERQNIKFLALNASLSWEFARYASPVKQDGTCN